MSKHVSGRIIPSRFFLAAALALLAGATACTDDRLLTPGAPRYEYGPLPEIYFLDPEEGTAGQTLQLDVRGSRFDPESQVELDGQPVPTMVRSGSYLEATISPELLGAGRDSAQVRVRTEHGLSEPAYLRVVNPVPVMTASTPDTAWLGSTTVVRVTGSGFVPTSTISIGGVDRATRYVSATQLETTISDTEVLARGPYGVDVTSPAPGGGSSPAGTLVVALARPVITGLHTSAARGAFQLTVYGKNLTPNTLVTVGGHGVMATRVSSTRVRAGISGRTPGTYHVRVYTVESGQASADSLPLRFRSAPTWDGAPLVATVDTLNPRALAVDAGSGRVYVAGWRGTPGSMMSPYLWSVNPSTRQVQGWGSSFPPLSAVAVAPSGTVFVAGGSAVYRFSPAWGQVVGGGPMPGTVYDLAVSRDSVVAVSYAAGSSPAVAIWRPAPLGSLDPGPSQPLQVRADVLEWSDSSRTLFGHDGLTPEHGIRQMTVGSSGAPVVSGLATGVTQAYNADMVHAAGRLYLSSGEVIDSETRALLGRCYVSGAVHPDPASGQIYYLTTYSIQVCDLNTFQVLGQINLPTGVTQSSGSGRPALLRWGSDGLVFHNGTRLYLLRSPVIAP